MTNASPPPADRIQRVLVGRDYERVRKMKAENVESSEIYGGPGGVRACNLPLRRGMLYPIELLRH